MRNGSLARSSRISPPRCRRRASSTRVLGRRPPRQGVRAGTRPRRCGGCPEARRRPAPGGRRPRHGHAAEARHHVERYPPTAPVGRQRVERIEGQQQRFRLGPGHGQRVLGSGVVTGERPTAMPAAYTGIRYAAKEKLATDESGRGRAMSLAAGDRPAPSAPGPEAESDARRRQARVQGRALRPGARSAG